MPIDYEARHATMEVLKSVLTEKNSDAFVRILKRRVKAKLPRWARWLPIGKVLDALLPEVLLNFLEDLLIGDRRI